VHLLPRDTASRLRLRSGTEQRPEVLRSDRAYLIEGVYPGYYRRVCLDTAHQRRLRKVCKRLSRLLIL